MELDNKKAYPKVCHQILDELSERLPDYLHYHCLNHTIDVANVCNFYIDYYLLSDRVANLIRIAAVAHDYGYIFDPKEHEERSIIEVRPMLTEYSDKEIAVIDGLIRATKVPQKPRNLYEQILSDADLDYLGREDYPQLSQALYEEFLYFGVVENQTHWLDVQIRFLEGHQFHTDWAKNNRTENKHKVIDGLKAKVSASGRSSRKAS
ncbi:MAG: HD domain-containing protein [Robiginitalea sp.]|uniref:HD domain-containing protein n=1 Tax=Robiginitalea sp. TaxID=1902411 RepID=UPI003C76D3C6